MNRPVMGKLLKDAMLDYVMHNSPMLNNYAKGIAEFTGLPVEVVRRSKPVREYARKILGF
jgi:hypothetical protein